MSMTTNSLANNIPLSYWWNSIKIRMAKLHSIFKDPKTAIKFIELLFYILLKFMN